MGIDDYQLVSDTIPAWIIALLMIYTGIIWLLSRRHTIRMDSRIFAITFITWGIVYGTVFQFAGLDAEVRGFLSRLMIAMICLSQSFPLTVAYVRSVRRGD